MGIIGVGMAFEKLHYPAYQMLSDKYEIAAISDFDRQKTEKWKNKLQLQDEDIYINFTQMLERSDINAFTS
jgi:predicted dehydrogenase